MTTQNDGGPAFPQSETANGNTVYAEHGEGGMSLRAYLAGRAMQGLLANRDWYIGALKAVAGDYLGMAAHDAVEAADALLTALAEREKGAE